MQEIPFHAVANAPIDSQLGAFSGLIDTVGDYNPGETRGKPWSFQRLVIIDPNSPRNKIVVKLKDRQELDKGWKGQVVYFIPDNQGRGLQMVDDSYTNSRTKKHVAGKAIFVYPEAEIEAVEGSEPARRAAVPVPPSGRVPANNPAPRQEAPPPARQQAASPPQQEQPPQTRQTQQPPPAKVMSKEDAERARAEAVRKARFFLARQANLMLLCIEAAEYIGDEYQKMHADAAPLPPEQFRTMASSLYIDANKAYLADGLPTEALANFLVKKQESAAQ